MNIPRLQDKKGLIPIPEAQAYGFVIPVMVEPLLWQQNCLSASGVNNQSVDCLLATCVSALKRHASRTDIVFDCKISEGSQSEPPDFAIELASSLEFDKNVQPYLMITYH